MIIGPSFCWLHLPKTGGTSTARAFRNLNSTEIYIDPDDDDQKHDSIDFRNKQQNSTLNEKTKIITIRRLSSWLISDWHHKTIKMNLSIPFAPVKSGLFYSLRLGGTWVAADYWIHYFKADQCDRFIRLENLEEDVNAHVLPLLPSGINELRFPHANTNKYSKDLEFYFNKKDLNRIYENNPAWALWEKNIYGNLNNSCRQKRLKAKLGIL